MILLACAAPAGPPPAELAVAAPAASPEAASTPVAAPAPAPPETPAAPSMEALLATTRAMLGDEAGAFTFVPSPPWLVVGDGPPAEVRRRATGTVAWATRQLRQDFFAADPSRIWTIWLFDGEASYQRHALQLFGDVPGTPYGYADGEEHALIMDISTGGGTLVHEMVHPFVAANLPGCPPWINEGLASLYEHVGEEDGHIHGYPNWRLPGLQAAIRAGRRPDLRGLAEADATRFYGDESGVNYATARYLMHWLQDRGRLRSFMAAYAAGRAADPSGFQTLLDSLDERDPAALAAAFDRWALALRRS